MTLTTALVIAAFAGSLYMLSHPARLYAVLAVLASGLELALVQGWVTFGIKGVSLTLVLGAVLAVAGAILFSKASSKLQVASGTIVTLVGALQVLDAIGAF